MIWKILYLLLVSSVFAQVPISHEVYINRTAAEAANFVSTAYFPPLKPDPIANLPPILKKIAQCESGSKQFGNDGQVLKGMVHPADWGYLQINTAVHMDEAAILGYDLTTLEGNIGFGKYLFEREGTVPWDSSRFCWAK